MSQVPSVFATVLVMSLNIIANLALTGAGQIQDLVNLASQPASIGQGPLPSLLSSYSYGTGPQEVDAFYSATRTVAATSFDLINLTSGITALGNTFALSAIKMLLLAIVAPDGVQKLRVGPQGQTDANQLWFGGTGATDYDEFFTYRIYDSPFAGLPVASGSTDVLPVYNPGASAVTYGIWVLGV